MNIKQTNWQRNITYNNNSFKLQKIAGIFSITLVKIGRAFEKLHAEDGVRIENQFNRVETIKEHCLRTE